jgi:hypothetical protein
MQAHMRLDMALRYRDDLARSRVVLHAQLDALHRQMAGLAARPPAPVKPDDES